MKMSIESAQQLQWFLTVLINDELSATYLSGGDHPNTWQFSVEAVYRLKLCDLVDFDFDVLTKSDKSPDTTYDGLDDFCRHLAMVDPDDWGADEIIWIDAQMHLTPKGRSLVEFYFKDFDSEHEINIPFIEHLERIFAEYQAPWNEQNPSFPVDISKLPSGFF
ncbi:hypothetical protein [Moraxella marmotae]|uniref:hypothetical protein n=1 Tax=Moraxella marmotae TaxID=3344520 RepID=UPI0035F447DD